MSTTTREPADTRSMGIVHSALRRDLQRARVVIGSPPYPDAARRRAIADHITWMMGFLHMHHMGEDKGLWPLVRSRKPDAAPLLDDMEADHLRIAPAVDALIEATCRPYPGLSSSTASHAPTGVGPRSCGGMVRRRGSVR